MRQFAEQVVFFKNKTVSENQPLTVDSGFDFGGLIRRLDLTVKFVVDINGGSGLTQEGMLAFVKNVIFKGGNDHFVNNVTGKALYHYANYLGGTLPGIDTVADADGTYQLHIPIYFDDKEMDYPTDSSIDARRYSKTGFYFQLLAGGIADVIGTVSTATMVVTATLTATMEKGLSAAVNAQGLPKGYRSYEQPAPFNPASTTILELEKNIKKYYRRLLVHVANSATAGSAFSGTAANTTLANIGFKSNVRTHFDDIPEWDLRYQNKTEFELETVKTGYYLLNLLEGKSNFEALNADPAILTVLQMKVTNGTLSTSQVSALLDCFYLYDENLGKNS